MSLWSEALEWGYYSLRSPTGLLHLSSRPLGDADGRLTVCGTVVDGDRWTAGEDGPRCRRCLSASGRVYPAGAR